jgi:simple sugar transport system permease protein
MKENTDTDTTQVKAFSLFVRIRKLPEFGAISSFLVMFIIFSVFGPGFLTFRNLTGVFALVAELGIMTIGISFLMISGEFDLSVSSVYAFAGFLFVVIGNHIPSPVALIIALAVAVGVGFLNGMIVMRVGLPSFIVTLGMMLFIRGMMMAITGGKTVIYKGDLIVPTILSRFLGHGLRPSHIWFIVLAAVFSYILTRTRYGNWVFATGGNKEVTRAMGVNVYRVKLANFMICALMAGLAGCIAINRFKSANPSFGTGMELEAIASAVIGGNFLTGGYGTIIGAFFGAFLMGTIRTGLVMMGAPAYWYQAFVGAILVIAATINIRLRRLQM